MKKEFVPKALDGEIAERVCVSVQDGASSTELHWHGCLEIIHVARGSAVAAVDETEVLLSAGDSLIVPAGRIHRCLCTDPEARRVVVGLEEELICPAGSGDRRLLPPDSSALNSRLCFRGTEHPETVALMGELASLSELPDGAARLTAEAAVLRIYALMYGEWERCGLIPAVSRDSETVAAIEAYVRDNCLEPINAKDAAARIGVSYSNMARLLNLHSRGSFSELLSAARIDAAKKRLITTDLSVTEIGYECGFTDTSYFISTFRRRTGVTPGAYRRYGRGQLKGEN